MQNEKKSMGIPPYGFFWLDEKKSKWFSGETWSIAKSKAWREANSVNKEEGRFFLEIWS